MPDSKENFFAAFWLSDETCEWAGRDPMVCVVSPGFGLPFQSQKGEKKQSNLLDISHLGI
jgi:hypothetical protein